MSRSLAGLAKFSGIALAGIVFIIGCVVGVAPSVPDSFKGDSPLSIISARGIPSAIGILAFAYVCQHNVLLNVSKGLVEETLIWQFPYIYSLFSLVYVTQGRYS